mmetsp:Transcript_81024/g.203993  ORF Transcript_81024/g.203993 Transcript_81024/m.203993 type:complete len:243 (-) Transcript_81024:45-773(-)
MPPSAFQELCEQRNVVPDEWRKSLACPILADKCLLDMTDQELEQHYVSVEERAENTREDRALIILERQGEGRLERQANKVFANTATNDKVCADQIPEMLEQLRFELTNPEIHFLLRKFDATEDFDMIPEVEFTRRQWLHLVGECQLLMDSYKHINQEAFLICYQTIIHNLKQQKDEGLEGTDQWPHLNEPATGLAAQGSLASSSFGQVQPNVWNVQPEVEAELLRQVVEYGDGAGAIVPVEE